MEMFGAEVVSRIIEFERNMASLLAKFDRRSAKRDLRRCRVYQALCSSQAVMRGRCTRRTRMIVGCSESPSSGMTRFVVLNAQLFS
jgi:hypothetical protein